MSAQVIDQDGTLASYFSLDRGTGEGPRVGWYGLVSAHAPDVLCDDCWDGTDCWVGPFGTSADAMAAARRERREK